MNRTYLINKENETKEVAKTIARILGKGDVLALYGDLGAGKTFFAQHLCLYLGVKENVSSPSFVILNEYAGNFPIFHFDLYRLDNEEELLEIGIYDVLETGITIIEWPELAQKILPKHTYHCFFSLEEHSRKLKIVKQEK
jgi:tRNA threonylcarbamoyladenosine biosynthesis protein TsaE